jgi:glycine dehydrogenase
MTSSSSSSVSALNALAQHDAFIHRHIGPSPAEIDVMLKQVGAQSLDELIAQTVPANILRTEPLALAQAISETEALAKLKGYADLNKVLTSFIGMGYYGTITPAVIQRNVLENPGWYTAYTPYQPEISQGRLEALLNFQQMIIDLTGMELSNASLLDEGTAAAEAMTLCKRMVKKNHSNAFFVASDCHPQTIAVVRTRAAHLGLDIVVGDPLTDLAQADVFGALLQYPGTHGDVHDLKPLIAQLHERNAMAVVAADIMSLVLLTPPGEMGADVVVGSSQRFGVPMGFGGPHAAFLATRDAFKRSMPGRLIGVSVDRRGNQALRMALQTREQHIRREKATSNICTAQALLAIMASFYGVYHGPDGLRTIASRIHRSTAVLAAGLEALGFARRNASFFDTLTIVTHDRTDAILERARDAGINLRRVDDHHVGIALDETTTPAHLRKLWQAFSGKQIALDLHELEQKAADGIPADLARTSPFMAHPVFNRYHSETEMLRYMKRLESKDIALNFAMIALGSCTMKLNATAEMMPITWPQFANLHPFAPAEQTEGYRKLFLDLEHMLAECTGYDRISLQPNAGSAGEYAGLIAIKRYHESRGETQRNVCLIPSSAHGTNPASAALLEMRVEIVECDRNGNVDINDLRAKAARFSNELAAIMVTYPSTHGVFEEGIREICDIVHSHGGQVYVDGANMNALVGIAAPGHFGADVSHLNLHKTFAIPHGGGGPGMGPIGVKSHLAPFLPTHPVVAPEGAGTAGDVVASAPWGSAGILPISWMYITMMGAEGLKKATEVAILNANYLVSRLKDFFPVLYTGKNGRVAHECIIDLRPLKEQTGVTEEDIAKRLIDFGFHAPTMSFPVPGTLMIEPTESESLFELDRFVEAMITIRKEIGRVESGEYARDDNPLCNAPHTLADICANEWTHCYNREEAAFPVESLRGNKYWPAVNRVDNVYGDRNLVCTCPSIDSYR